MDNIIDIQNLHFSYRKNHVLRGLNLQVKPGEVVALLGPNGCGKTTLIDNILGTAKPESGSVRVLGIDPARPTAQFLARLGVVQQTMSRDDPSLTLRTHLEYIAVMLESGGVETVPVEQICKQLGLEEKLRAKMKTLSGGQRRRADLAAALLGNPELMILDEPTVGLDPHTKAQFHDLLSDSLDRGATVVLATQDLAEAEKVASRIAILNEGVIAHTGTATQLRQQFGAQSEITWTEDGKPQVHSTTNPAKFLSQRDLSQMQDLSVSTMTLEEAYLRLVQGPGAPATEESNLTSEK